MENQETNVEQAVDTAQPVNDVKVPDENTFSVTLRVPMERDYKFTDMTNFVYMPNASLSEMTALDSPINSVDPEKQKPPVHWLRGLKQSMNVLYVDNAFDSTVKRKGGDWQQGVNHNGKAIGLGSTNILPGKEGTLLTGEAAIMRIRSITNMGSNILIPLWGSGVWIKVQAPSDAELMELDRSIADAKTELGRSTVGSIFSNESVYINSILATFILERVIDSNVVGYTTEILKSLIKVTDFPHMVGGFASVIFKNGYPDARPCINNPRSCHYVHEQLLSVSKMIVTDNQRISAQSRAYMENPNTTRTIDQVRLYQSAFEDNLHVNRVIDFIPNVHILLRIPSLAEYEDSGYRWVSSIVALTEGSLSTPLEGNQRENFIKRRANLTRLREYGHWIEEILIPETGEIIRERDSLERVMEDLTSLVEWEQDKESLADTILTKIAAYINDTTVTVVGIAKYDCPQCGTSMTDGYERTPELIVVDVVKLFFILGSLKVNSNLSRR